MILSELEGEFELETFLEQFDPPTERVSLTSLPHQFKQYVQRGLLNIRFAFEMLAGERDENKLTNKVFFDRHPERAGRPIQSHEKGLVQEWLQIRNEMIRPLLVSLSGGSSSTSPGLPKIADSKTKNWSAIRDRVVAIAKREYEVVWAKGTKTEGQSEMVPVLLNYYKEGVNWSKENLLKASGQSLSNKPDTQLLSDYFKSHAWSAVFISWVMVKAGAASEFKPTPAHRVYVSEAKTNRINQDFSKPVWAYRIGEVQPRLGDIVVRSRGNQATTYDNINPKEGTTHGDIVIEVEKDKIWVIGGNVAQSVRKRPVALDANGKIKSTGNSKNDFFAIIRIVAGNSGKGQADILVSPLITNPVSTPLPGLSEAEIKAIRLTNAIETTGSYVRKLRHGKNDLSFNGLTGNFDGQGLSFGLLQWNIGTGSLLPLLTHFNTSYRAQFDAIFGQDAAKMREVLSWRDNRIKRMNWARSINDSKNHIKEPWASYFKRLANNPSFQQIQLRHIQPSLTAAKKYAKSFEFKTERGLALMFDIVTQQGASWYTCRQPRCKKRKALIQQRMADARIKKPGGILSEIERLTIIANVIADVAKPEYKEMVRTRKMAIVNGYGKVHGHNFDLKKEFGITDAPWD